MTNSDETVPHVIMAPRSPDFSFGVDVHDRYELDIPKERLEAMSPLKRRLIKGPAKRVTLTGDDREGAKWRPLPPFFMAGGLTISEPLADLLRGFDLGPALIRPVELTAPKGADRGLAYYSLVVKPVAPTYPVIIDRCRNLVPEQPGDSQRFVEFDVGAGDIVLSAEQQGTADLWYDPGLFSVYFASGALSQVLIEAGMAEALWLVPCSFD